MLNRYRLDMTEVYIISRADIIVLDVLTNLELDGILEFDQIVRLDGYHHWLEIVFACQAHIPDKVRCKSCDTAFLRKKGT